jgi:hypothetical protein
MKNKRAKSRIFHYDFLEKNRKGFLLAEETLKIIIAVICISFLVYFLISLYMKNSESKDLEMAKTSLERLIKEINVGHDSVEIYNPKGWFVISWPKDVNKRIFYMPWKINTLKNVKPLFCENLGWDNCLCICNGDSLDDCENQGICLESSTEVQEGKIKINPPLSLKINEDIITK